MVILNYSLSETSSWVTWKRRGVESRHQYGVVPIPLEWFEDFASLRPAETSDQFGSFGKRSRSRFNALLLFDQPSTIRPELALAQEHAALRRSAAKRTCWVLKCTFARPVDHIPFSAFPHQLSVFTVIPVSPKSRSTVSFRRGSVKPAQNDRR